MNNPLSILRFLWRSRRPSRIGDMPAAADAFWLGKGYAALTFFGTIVTATKEEAAHINSHDDELKRHEMIHLMQARDTHDSWVCFYLLYIYYYLRALPMNRRLRNAAYLLNPFELEAYAHMHDAHYLECPECGRQWRVYARMKPSERLRFFLRRRVR